MEIKQSEVGGYDIHADSSERWLLLKALEALLASNSRDSYEEQLIDKMIRSLEEVLL